MQSFFIVYKRGINNQSRGNAPVLTKRCGYVFPLILFATLAVGMFIVSITQFQSSNRLKAQHLNDYQSAFNIAYSALVEIFADVQAKQWSNRSFKSGPVDKSASLFGGKFELRVEDHDTVEFAFNVRIRVTYKNKRHLFYWRLIYNPNLLDFTRLFIPIYYEDFSDPTAIPSDLDEIVDKKIKQREDNQPRIHEIADAVKPSPTVGEALKVVGVNPDGVKMVEEERPEGPEIYIPKTDLPLTKLTDLISTIAPETTFVIKDFCFAVAEQTLDSNQRMLLEALAEVLQSKPDLKMELRGHCDTIGDSASNLELSINRAQAVKTYLVLLGVSPDRLTVKGFGETQPIASNDTEEGKKKNRRVEFVVN